MRQDNAVLAAVIRTIFREFKIDKPGTVYTDPTTDHLYEVFTTPGSAYWIAEKEGEIVGGCGIFPTKGLPEGYAELVKFYLSADARGTGIGRTLMEQTYATAKALGYTHLYLESFPNLERAINMYIKDGFTPLSRPLGNSGHYACNVWMEKKL
ncbi:MAG: GNAT family N-acetyltransferase [Sphingobacteriales bacterium]|nr:MAG: GNAT family N-acetyltransferase [Sphingobacteriales bacterium]